MPGQSLPGKKILACNSCHKLAHIQFHLLIESGAVFVWKPGTMLEHYFFGSLGKLFTKWALLKLNKWALFTSDIE